MKYIKHSIDTIEEEVEKVCKLNYVATISKIEPQDYAARNRGWVRLTTEISVSPQLIDNKLTIDIILEV